MANTIPTPIEVDLRTYLENWMSENGYDYPVYLEVEKDMPSKYYLLEKTASYEQNHIYEATIAMQSIAESLASAAELNEIGKIAMKESVSEDRITSCKVNTDYPFTDTTTKEYRYQAVLLFKHY